MSSPYLKHSYTYTFIHELRSYKRWHKNESNKQPVSIYCLYKASFFLPHPGALTFSFFLRFFFFFGGPTGRRAASWDHHMGGMSLVEVGSSRAAAIIIKNKQQGQNLTSAGAGTMGRKMRKRIQNELLIFFSFSFFMACAGGSLHVFRLFKSYA